MPFDCGLVHGGIPIMIDEPDIQTCSKQTQLVRCRHHNYFVARHAILSSLSPNQTVFANIPMSRSQRHISTLSVCAAHWIALHP
jgi:hypothetical protein